MDSILSWSPTDGYPQTTPTVLKSVATSEWDALSASLSNAIVSLQTATYPADLVLLSEIARGAQASLSIISAEQVLATATDTDTQASATQVIAEAMYNLHELARDESNYAYYLNRGGNIFYFTLFTLAFIFYAAMVVRLRYHWFNVAFVCGFSLQFMGWLGRILSFVDDQDINYFLLQYVCLTISPAFLMGGIYFLFAQCVILHGRQYSVLKPMWYSYFFIACDVFSLVIQGTGGGMASVASQNKTDVRPGVWTMFGGILFQVLAMTVFLAFWFEYLARVFWHDRKNSTVESPYWRKNPKNYFKLLFNTPSAREHKRNNLEPFYNPRFADIRARPLTEYLHLAISAAVVLIYIRCVYRVVELKQGFDGYLASHEVYLMTLDGLMIALSALIFIPFHPFFVFGSDNRLALATIKQQDDQQQDEKHVDDAVNTESSSTS